jgi:two-component system sensor histidine kinase YesM
VDQVAANIESYVNYMESVSSFVLSNQDIQDYLRAADGVDKRRLAARAAAVLDTIVRSRTDISLVAVFGYDGGFVTHSPDLRLNPFADPVSLPWYSAARNAVGRPAVSTPHVQNVVKDHYRW